MGRKQPQDVDGTITPEGVKKDGGSPVVTKELRKFEGHTDDVRSVAFSPDGRHVLTGSDDDTARLWDTTTGAEVRKFIEHKSIQSVAYSPDGKYVLSGSSERFRQAGSARLWDVNTGKEIRHFGSSACNCVAFSPDGKFVLTGGSDGACLWDTNTGKEVRKLVEEFDCIYDVSFSPDGKYVLTAGFDKTARLWAIEE